METKGLNDVSSLKKRTFRQYQRIVSTLVFLMMLMVLPGYAQESLLLSGGSDVGGSPAKGITTSQAVKYKDGEILVKFKAHVVEDSKHRAHSKHGAHKIQGFKSINVHHVKLKEGMSVEEAIKLYQSNPDVVYAEPNYIGYLDTTAIYPNDPDWYYQKNDFLNAHISEAWNITTGSSDVVVAVLDTNVRYDHPDLFANIWVNNNPGIDVDGKHITNDLYGYDAYKFNVDGTSGAGISSIPDPLPIYDYGHGTHVAGVIGAVGNNGIGITGVNWNVKIMLCTVGNESSGVSASAVVACLDYVKAQKDRGVKIVATNNSYGSGGQAVRDAIAAQQDILYVNSSGNAMRNNDITPNSPGDDLPNYIGVTSPDGTFNYGPNTVHLNAPLAWTGLDKWGGYTGYPNNYGTSFVAPVVTGLAALIKAHSLENNLNYDGAAIRNLMFTGGEEIEGFFSNRTVTNRMINAYNSLTCNDRQLFRVLKAPSAITIGMSSEIKVISLNCAAPAGPVYLAYTDVNGSSVTMELKNREIPNTDHLVDTSLFYGDWTPTKDLETLTISGPGGIVKTQTTYTIPTVVTASLPPATATIGYNQTLQGGSGTPPYTWAWSGAIPEGLSMSETGVISGIPATPDFYSFNITITDSLFHSSVKTLSLEVLNPQISQDFTINDTDTSNYHSSSAKEIVTDSNGNLYVGIYNIYSYSNSNLVIKYSAAGTYLWAIQQGNVSYLDMVHIAIDRNDNLVKTDNLVDGSFNVSKYNQTGVLVWSKNSRSLVTSGNPGIAQGIGVDTTGNVYVKAYDPTNGHTLIVMDPASGTILPSMPVSVAPFDRMTVDQDGTIIGTSIESAASYRLIAYHPSGAVKWTDEINTQSANGSVAATDGNGNVYFAGGYKTVGYVIAKYSADGTQRWNRYINENIYNNLKPLGVSVDWDGTMYVTFGNNALQNYIVAYDTDGNLLWQRRYDGVNLLAITTDNINHVYLAGQTATNGKYVIVRFADNKYQISTKVVPAGYKTKTYSAKILSAGGGTAINWSVASGRLPNGLVLTGDATGSGLISGIPSEAGNFSFTLQITNASGTKASRFFTLTILPEISITSPAAITYSTSPTLTYTAIDGTVVVKVDGITVNKASGATLDGLPDGLHTVRVEVTDGNGVTLYSEVSFTLDTVKPNVVITSPVSGVTTDRSPILSYTTSSGTAIVMLDGLEVPLLSGDALGALSVGPHTVRVEAADPAGNWSYAEVSFTISDFLITDNIFHYTYNGENGFGEGEGVTHDAAGNIYVTGTVNTGTNSNFAGALVTIKYDATGHQQWSQMYNPYKVFPGYGGVIVDDAGNVYVSGIWDDSHSGFFMVKYDPTGNLIWATEESGGNAIALGKDGFIYSANTSKLFSKTSPDGTTNWSVPLEFQASAIAVDTDNNILIACNENKIFKYDSSGNKLRTYIDSSVWGDSAKGIAVDSAGNAYVVGDSGSARYTSLITKYDTDGNVVWRRIVESVLFGIAVNIRGDIYATGSDSIKYDSDGNTLWTKGSFNDNAYMNGAAIAADNIGNVYVTGYYQRNGIDTIIYRDTLYSTLRIIPPPSTSGTVGTAYSMHLLATGGVKAYVWSISAGSLPAGLSLDPATGVISGTLSATGRFLFTVQVTDKNGVIATRDLSVSVYEPITITSPSSGLTYSSRPLLSYTGINGNEATVVVAVDGVVIGKFTGATLDELSNGPHKVRVMATSADGYTRSAEVSFNVDAVAPIITITSPLAGIIYSNHPVLLFTASEGTAVVTVDGVVVPLVSGDTLGPFAEGPHTIRVDATDLYGNSSFYEVTVTLKNGMVVEEWRKSINSTQPYSGGNIAVDNSENVYVASQVVNGSNIDFLVNKYDVSGNVIWSKTYGNNSTTGNALSIVVDTAGNIYINGMIGNNTSVLLKLNAAGEVLWRNNYDGNSAKGIGLDTQGNVSVASVLTSSVRVVKYSPDGNILSPYPVDYPGQFLVASVALDMTGNMYVFGHEYTGTEYDYKLLKILSTGVVDWEKTYSWGWVDQARAVTVGKDGNVYTTGYSRTHTEYYKMYTQIIDPSGQLLWSGLYPIETTRTDIFPDGIENGFANAISVDEDGNSYVAGKSGIRSKNNVMQLVKYDATGNTVWTQSEAGVEFFGITTAKSGNMYAIGAVDYVGNQVVIKYKQFVISTAAQQSAALGPYSLSLSASGGLAPYNSWSVISGALPVGLALDSATGVIGGTLTTAGTYSFTVQVTDGKGAATQKVIRIDVLAITSPDSLSDGYLTAAYSQTLTAVGGKSPYTWSITTGALPAGLSLNATTATITGIPTIAGTSSITFLVSDANAVTATKDLSISVYDVPVVSIASLPDVYLTTAYNQTLAASGGKSPYTWSITTGTLPAGLSLNASTATITGIPTIAGTSSITLLVSDANAVTATKDLSISVYDVPVVSIASLPDVYLTTAYNQTLAASGGKSPYTWSLTTGTLPAGLSLNASTGAITGMPTTVGISNITFELKDTNNISASKSLTITVNAALTISTTSLPEVYVGNAYSQVLTVAGGKTPYSWGIASGTLPTGLSLNSSTGAITGTPIAAGTSSITFQVSDANAVTATKALTITVYAVPVIGPAILPDGYLTTPYNQTLAVIGGKSPYIWNITTGILPTGLSLNTSTGAITGTPTATGSPTITFQIKDAGNLTALKSLTISIYALPNITTTSCPVGTIGAAYTCNLTATGGKTPNTWSVASGTLLAGLSLNSTSGVITGTPTAAGTSNITFQVTDSNAVSAIKALPITVNSVPVVSTISLSDGYLTSPYNQTLAVSGGKSPYSWSITTGTLPTGLSLNTTTGAITGTPTATGSKTMTFQVKDAGNLTANKSLTITIYALPRISTTSCPGGTVGIAYTCNLAATGGKTPYAWNISVGSLPAGLALNPATGVISGIPTAVASSSFTSKVTDANSKTATKALSIAIVTPVVAQLKAWTNLYSASPNNASATNLAAGNITVGSGSNRLLLVSVVMEIGTAANPTISATFGGVPLTQEKITNNTQREIVWVGYLKESQIGSGSKALAITYSGATGNASALHVKWAAFTGVNQTTPIASSGGTSTATTSATFGSTISYVANGMTTVVAGNGGTPATGTLSATPAFTAGTATTTNAQTSRTFTTAKHTAAGSYASTIKVTWTKTTSAWSGLVAVSLQP